MDRRARLRNIELKEDVLSPTFINIPSVNTASTSASLTGTDSDDDYTTTESKRGIPEVFFAGNSSLPGDYNSEDSEDEISTEEQLDLAKMRINELESWLEHREKELRVAQDKLRQLAASGRRLRRHARSGDLFNRDLPRTNNSDEINHLDSEPVEEYMLLHLLKVCDQESFMNHAVDDPRNEAIIPLYMRRLEGEFFAIGPNGATIGTGQSCGVKLPSETGVNEIHSSITWNPSKKEFILENANKEQRQSYLYVGPTADADDLDNIHNYKALECITLKSGTIFQTESIRWKISAIPHRQLLITQMFRAIRHCDIHTLNFLDVCVTSWNENISKGLLSNEEKRVQLINFNVLENVQYQVVEENYTLGSRLSCDRYSLTVSQDQVTTQDNEQMGKFSLLHVAVDYVCLPIVKFLLDKGVLVNKQCGIGKFSPLHIAVRHNSSDVINELLKYGADLELTDASHRLPISLAGSYSVRKILLSSMMLCSAAEGGDMPEVQHMITSSKISPNVKGLSHKSPLHLASAGGHSNVVSYLLDNGASIDMKGGKNERTALHYASLNDHLSVARLLIAYGANQDVTDNHGYTPLNLSNGGDICRLLHKGPLSLCLAAQTGDIDEVRRLLEGGSPMQRRKGSTVNSQSHRKVSRVASERKVSRQAVTTSLGLLAAIDQRNEQGHAPLHMAATAGNLAMVELLVSYGATIDLPGGLDKWTSLFYASLAGHSDVVGFLLSVGADCERLDAQGLMAIDHVESNIEGMTQKLEQRHHQPSIEDGRDDNSPNSKQNLLPPQLMRQGSDSMLSANEYRKWRRKQLTRQQQVLIVLQSGMQRLLHTLEQENLVEFEEVLSRGNIDLNGPLTKHTPTTPLQYASSSGLLDFVRLLLDHGADPCHGNNQSYLPIHTAARYGNDDIVLLFVKYDIDINIKSKHQGSTPLHLAAANDRERCVKELLLAGADPSIKDIDDETPFDVTSMFALQELLAKDDNRLFVAIVRGNMKEICHLIEDEGISANCCFKQNLTPLHIACKEGNVEIVRYLLIQEANPNAQGGQDSTTPLHIISRGSSTDIAELLITNGAKLNISNANGKTAFEESTTNAMRKVLVSAQVVKQSQENILQSEEIDNSNEDTKERNCRICFAKPINTIILPCGHQAFCMDCACKLEVCAFDRRPISQIVPVFYAGVP